MIDFALEFPIVAFALAILSLVIKPSKAGGISALLAVAGFLLVATTHFWLID